MLYSFTSECLLMFRCNQARLSNISSKELKPILRFKSATSDLSLPDCSPSPRPSSYSKPCCSSCSNPYRRRNPFSPSLLGRHAQGQECSPCSCSQTPLQATPEDRRAQQEGEFSSFDCTQTSSTSCSSEYYTACQESPFACYSGAHTPQRWSTTCESRSGFL